MSLPALLALLLLPAFAGQNRRTDLGEAGNEAAARAIEAYSPVCRASGSGKKVLLTGFRPFAGESRNVSGELVSAMSEGRQTATLQAGGRPVQVCFVILSVTWDVAPAIVVKEMTAFKPDLVLMTGASDKTIRLETFARNYTEDKPGFDAGGRSLGENNQPVSRWVLSDYEPGYQMGLSWNARAVADAIRAPAQELGFSPSVMDRDRKGQEDYICNATSLVAQHASGNRVTRLAGERVVLRSPELPNAPAVGFMHLPHDAPPADERTLPVWKAVFSSAIASALADR